MTTVHHKPEAMLPILIRTNPKIKQEIKTVLRREVQEEIKKNLCPKEDIHKEKGENYPAENASKIHMQIFLGVQTLRDTYQENQMDQIASLRKYAGCA